MGFHLLAFYGGPDQVLTVTSSIASVAGFLLIFWNKLVAGFHRLFGVTRKPAEDAGVQDGSKKS
ncbi:MAG: hypothetical protein J2P13_10895 [Acidobacteria bacterium]|nr:hypothetical protein [Acidobacteriota bacterium]